MSNSFKSSISLSIHSYIELVYQGENSISEGLENIHIYIYIYYLDTNLDNLDKKKNICEQDF